jgi:hypothetical protein
VGETTFQWLIERGQPEGETRPVWLEHSGRHPATRGQWTTNAWDAAMFPSRETAEAYIAAEALDARAVEHGFMAKTPEDERGWRWEDHSADCPARAGDTFYCECGADPSRARGVDPALPENERG